MSVGTFLRDESGAGLIEYAIILACVAVAATGALLFMGRQVNTLANQSAGLSP